MRASISLHQRVDGTESICSNALINADSFLSLSRDLRVYSAVYFADLSKYLKKLKIILNFVIGITTKNEILQFV